MGCLYNVLLCKHPVDGLRLAMRHLAGEQTVQRAPLILALSGGPLCALQFGMAVPPEYSGVAGLLYYEPQQLAVDIAGDAGQFRVILPAADSSSHYAELLDRMRPAMPDDRVTVVMEYRRVSQDLPPLLGEDRVVCFWEARDLLDDEHLQALEHLAERLDNEQPGFAGLKLYARGQQADAATLSQRKQHIEASLGLSCGDEVMALAS